MNETPTLAQKRRLPLAILPLLAFLGLAGLLFLRLGAGDASKLPSALLGHAAPSLNLVALEGKPGLTDADLRAGHVSLINVFGSWCQPCHLEHEYLLALADDPGLKAKGVALYGIAQRDSAENVKRFLGAAGDPYAKIGLDPDDKAGIDWGVYGVPETYILRGDGTIAYKFVGPMDSESIERVVKPQILQAMK